MNATDDCQIVSNLLSQAHATPITANRNSSHSPSQTSQCCNLPPSVAQCSFSSAPSTVPSVTSLTLTPATVSFPTLASEPTDHIHANATRDMFLIPPELGNLAALQILVLSAPTLSGPIPPSIRQLKQLKQLSIWNSRINGSIPDVFDSSFSRLTSIHIFDNPNLSGPIPSSLAQIPNLQTLDLSGNRLSSIPANLLANLPTTLTDLSITGNNLTGPLPRVPSHTLSRCDLASANAFTCLSTPLPPSCTTSNPALAFLPSCSPRTPYADWPLGVYIALGAACAVLVVAGVFGARMWRNTRREKRAASRAKSAVAFVDVGQA
ncbi:hypothetical protein BCR44DRAFT_40319 [Catenaria anguillulae PL171]|uniref:L domain-like protein n=1 Tax=Catenaria anguillulae PL171 TaxID=765915 RepID=A0A1Y2HPT9_9FUNG|nr:hypothetical protein BCR44DRAFT_40319 [Catenaria anguillulae PL171]